MTLRTDNYSEAEPMAPLRPQGSWRSAPGPLIRRLPMMVGTADTGRNRRLKNYSYARVRRVKSSARRETWSAQPVTDARRCFPPSRTLALPRMPPAPRLGHVQEQQAQAEVGTRRRYAEPLCAPPTNSGEGAATDGHRTMSVVSPATTPSEVRDESPLKDCDSHRPTEPIPSNWNHERRLPDCRPPMR